MTNNDSKLLPSSIIADWFKTSLVLVSEKDVVNIPNIEKITPCSVKYLGNNEKKIAVIVNNETNTHLDEISLSFLTNILQACQFNLSDIALINVNQQDIDYQQLQKELHITKCILFGVDTEKIHLPFSLSFFTNQLYNDISFICAPDLVKINNKTSESKLLKAQLWNCLQIFFNLK